MTAIFWHEKKRCSIDATTNTDPQNFDRFAQLCVALSSTAKFSLGSKSVCIPRSTVHMAMGSESDVVPTRRSLVETAHTLSALPAKQHVQMSILQVWYLAQHLRQRAQRLSAILQWWHQPILLAIMNKHWVVYDAQPGLPIAIKQGPISARTPTLTQLLGVIGHNPGHSHPQIHRLLEIECGTKIVAYTFESMMIMLQQKRLIYDSNDSPQLTEYGKEKCLITSGIT